ncbi:MAG: hypothetical protein ACRDR6_12450 [Pseudonocardiaceae bacterium]
MVELLKAVESWRSLLVVLVVFGLAPGVCLRQIVRVYPPGDPRRAELIAELYAVPRWERPLWVAEQLEVALSERHRGNGSGEGAPPAGPDEPPEPDLERFIGLF